MPVRTVIESLEVAAYTIPTDAPESDGSIAWDSTTMVLVEVAGGSQHALGYSYADAAAAFLIHERLMPLVIGADALSPAAVWQNMLHALRNTGRPGIASMAVAAVDIALWDLKAKILDLPLATLLGQVRDAVPIYGSGGFTSYSDTQLRDQLGHWAAEGLPRVKMKICRDPGDDPRRVRLARQDIGPDTELFVDANGACTCKQALALAEDFAESGVTWFEEPVCSDDLEGLRLIRDRAPAGMQIAAGEYGFDLYYFRRMLEAGAVDVLQADATRCGGITSFLGVGPLCAARNTPLSAHTAPAIHLTQGGTHAINACPRRQWPEDVRPGFRER